MAARPFVISACSVTKPKLDAAYVSFVSIYYLQSEACSWFIARRTQTSAFNPNLDWTPYEWRGL